jgi:hypothetical protein
VSDYTPQIALAVQMIDRYGASVTFSRTAETYDPVSGAQTQSATTATGVAVKVKGSAADAERLRAFDLVPTSVDMLLVAAHGLAFAPAPQDTATFGTVSGTVRDVDVLDLNGSQPILYRVAVAR